MSTPSVPQEKPLRPVAPPRPPFYLTSWPNANTSPPPPAPRSHRCRWPETSWLGTARRKAAPCCDDRRLAGSERWGGKRFPTGETPAGPAVPQRRRRFKPAALGPAGEERRRLQPRRRPAGKAGRAGGAEGRGLPLRFYPRSWDCTTGKNPNKQNPQHLLSGYINSVYFGIEEKTTPSKKIKSLFNIYILILVCIL